MDSYSSFGAGSSVVASLLFDIHSNICIACLFAPYTQQKGKCSMY